MDMIAHRMKHTYYKELQEFVSDFNLMFKNAMTYNEDGSQVYTDAQALKQAFESQLQELCPNGQVPLLEENGNEPSDVQSRKRGRNGESDLEDSDAKPHLKIKVNVGKKMKAEPDSEEE